MRIYIVNNSTDDSALATGTRLTVSLPTCTGTSIGSSAYISAFDSFPGELWNDVAFTSDEPFNLAYRPATAEIYNNAQGSPFALTTTDFLEAEGQLIGFDDFDGVVRPGYAYANYFYFEVVPQFAPE
ncbi:hypothetical protein [Tessaracoccus lacteus]|uniref:Uncharacterized protein n=1 Tax=Tessaracoccus lacteus TaxID=3041766 RepID=A0ABY8PX42_9ACTN|nr:hypothetical protein [Tessaracoccus sp. T21]WGT47053.1 hypothetical protein QH948_13200 [Tessaracoccus sp. T21]